MPPPTKIGAKKLVDRKIRAKTLADKKLGAKKLGAKKLGGEILKDAEINCPQLIFYCFNFSI